VFGYGVARNEYVLRHSFSTHKPDTQIDSKQYF